MADEKDEVENPDIHFEPIVSLPPVEIKSLEEEEEELLRMRAKLYRYDKSAEPAEWKERGTGDVKILKHKDKGICRVLMRRDKTLKICANHYVSSDMELKPNCGSDRAWVWSVLADFADEEAKSELLAIRFANKENAQKFKEKFVEAQKANSEASKKSVLEKEENNKDAKENNHSTEDKTDDVADKLGELSVKDQKDTDKSPEKKESEGGSETNTTKDSCTQSAQQAER